MKKVLILLMTLLLCGCTDSFGQIHTVAILGKAETDEAVIVFTDKAGNVASKEIEYPAVEYFGDEAVYYSADRINYKSISYHSLKEDDEIRNINGILLYHMKNGCTYAYENNMLNVYRNGNLARSESYGNVKMIKVEKGLLYQTDPDDILRIYDVRDDSLLKELDVSDLDVRNVTTVNGSTYLVSLRGYTLLKDYEIDSTFVYPVSFDEIWNCTGKYISVINGREVTAYRVSFDKYQMIMDQDYDDDFIGYVDFEKIYSEWYEKGYEVIDFHGYVGE